MCDIRPTIRRSTKMERWIWPPRVGSPRTEEYESANAELKVRFAASAAEKGIDSTGMCPRGCSTTSGRTSTAISPVGPAAT